MTWLSLHTTPLLAGSSQTAYEVAGSRYRRVLLDVMRFDPRRPGVLINASEVVVDCGLTKKPIVCAALGPLEFGPGVVHNRFSFGDAPILPGHNVTVTFKIGGLTITMRDQTFEGTDRKTRALEEIAFSNLADLPDSIRMIARRGLGWEANQ